MYINKNDNTLINRPIEITVNGVTYPKQVFDNPTMLTELNIVKAKEDAYPDGTLYTFVEEVDYVNNHINRTPIPRTAEEIRDLTIPMSITKVQAMKAMKQAGVWDTFKTAIASNTDANDEWTLALDLVRDNPFILILAPVLGLTDNQIDDLFILGSTL